MKFTKMHGAGNDYVYVDRFAEPDLPTDPAALGALARRLSDRHTGVGGDGLIVIERGADAPFRMNMFNADGSPSAMCGNGLRCVAKFVADAGYVEGNADAFDVESGAGVHHVAVAARDGAGHVSQVKLALGEPQLTNAGVPTAGPAEERTIDYPLDVGGETVRITCVGMGNPHAVIFVPDTQAAPVTTLGPQIERHPYFPERTNVEFVQIAGPDTLIQRTWERGTGETLACGSGAAAVVVAATLLGHASRRATVRLLGGELAVEWDESTNQVMKTGPAVTIFSGQLADGFAG